MARLVGKSEALIGNTPLVRLERLGAGLGAELLAKLEMLNPSGSSMDRVARAILNAAETTGELQPGDIIVEPTSGNIAFSLVTVAVPRGYHLILVMPETVPGWRVQLLRALGAEVVLTPELRGMRGAVEQARLLAEEYPRVFRPNQFSNPVSPAAHEQTAMEIWEACEGEVAAVSVSVGTGSLISGVGHRLKALSDGAVQVVAVEPAASPVLSGGSPGAHRLHGMGAPFIPGNYDPTIVDEILPVSETECQDTLFRLYRSEGIMSGPAGGAALAAALRLAERAAFEGKHIVTVIPDNMERYATLPFWQQYNLVTPTMPESEEG